MLLDDHRFFFFLIIVVLYFSIILRFSFFFEKSIYRLLNRACLSFRIGQAWLILLFSTFALLLIPKFSYLVYISNALNLSKQPKYTKFFDVYLFFLSHLFVNILPNRAYSQSQSIIYIYNNYVECLFPFWNRNSKHLTFFLSLSMKHELHTQINSKRNSSFPFATRIDKMKCNDQTSIFFNH